MLDQVIERNSEKDLLNQLYAKIAKYVAVKVPVNQIAVVFSLSHEELMAVFEDPDFQQVLATETQQKLDTQISSDQSWDRVENAAITRLSMLLEVSHDPEQLLKIAATANKAQRRTNGEVRAQAENVQLPDGRNVPVQLKISFVNNVQAAPMQVTRESVVLEGQSIEDSASVSDVKDVFGVELDITDPMMAPALPGVK